MSIAHRNAQQSTSGSHLPVLVQSAGVVEERSGPDAEAIPQGAWGWVQNHRDDTKFRWTRTHDFWPNAEYPKYRGVTRNEGRRTGNDGFCNVDRIPDRLVRWARARRGRRRYSGRARQVHDRLAQRDRDVRYRFGRLRESVRWRLQPGRVGKS